MTVGGNNEISLALNGLSLEHVDDGTLLSLDEARNNNTSIEINGDDWCAIVPFNKY